MASPGRRQAKRARPGLAADPQDVLSGSPPPDSDWRDWVSLTAGPAGLIAEHALANDVTDYIRFRAVCTSWRACSADPRASGVSDRRFHPRRWIMLPRASKSKASNRPRCFLNVYTGERIRVRHRGLGSNCCVGPIIEGLVVLWRSCVVQLLNPLTGQFTDFPGAPGLDPCRSNTRGGGLADDSTVALICTNGKLAVAKPGDKDWTLLTSDDYMLLALPFAGRLYCITEKNILALQTAANQEARLVVIAELKLEGGFTATNDYLYPVYDEEGGLILVHRRATDDGSCLNDTFAAYRVTLDTGNVEQIRDLGGQALFVCGSLSQSVAARISSSISADTVYVCTNDPDNRGLPKVVAFDLTGTSTQLD